MEKVTCDKHGLIPKIELSIQDPNFNKNEDTVLARYCFVCWAEAMDKLLGIKNYK